MSRIRRSFIISIILILMCNFKVLGFDSSIFTEQEIEYINTHKKIYIAGNNMDKPIESYNKKEDTYIGIMPELFSEITKICGIEFEYINKDDDWHSYANQKQVEIVSGLEEGSEFEKTLPFVNVLVGEKNKKVSIGFTEIANENLINIIEKSMKEIEDIQKQKIIVDNLVEYNHNVNYIFLGIVIGIILIVFILFILYKKSKNDLKKEKYIDNITEYGNYQNMEVDFNNILTEENKTAYCIINIGIDLSQIEQRQGYRELQEVLKSIADILAEYINDNESFTRIFKDNFIILANFITDKDIKRRVNSILEEIEDIGKERAYKIIANAGIYFLKRSDNDFLQVIFYSMQARKEGEEQDIKIRRCTDSLLTKLNKKDKLEKNAIRAIENNEFVPYIQPIVNLHDDSVSTIEVLARWENPQEGLLKPDDFMQILKNNNRQDKLDFYMFEESCKELLKMKKDKKPLYKMFCNFSRDTMEREGFLENIQNIVDLFEVPKRYIGIVITKGDRYSINLKSIIEKLRKLGFSVLLDDFGETSYSLKDLQQLQIDYLKISPKLTENLTDKKAIFILKGIIDIAHGLNIKVVCENIETKDKESVLKFVGCDMVQGKAYYQPIPIEEMY